MDNWRMVFEGKVGARDVTLYRYSEGEYRVKTTELSGGVVNGYHVSGGDVTKIPFPAPFDRDVNFDAEDLDELQRELYEGGFADTEVAEIIEIFKDDE